MKKGTHNQSCKETNEKTDCLFVGNCFIVMCFLPDLSQCLFFDILSCTF